MNSIAPAPVRPSQRAARRSHAWIPHRILGVGVTGHRPERLGTSNLKALQTAVAQVLGEISRAATATTPTRLRLISPLAEGADSIVADEALARGWALDAVLPFARDDYAEDFDPGEARDDHLQRLAAANAVFELPGDRQGEEGAEIAYERAGRIVLAQCDLLIAVWDNGPVRGRGGAAQVVAEAVLRGIPVIQIDPAGARPPTLLWDGIAEVDLGQQTVETVARGAMGHIDGLIRDLLDPPANREDKALLARFCAGADHRWAFALTYPLLLALTGVRRLRWSDLRLPSRRSAKLPEIGACSTADAFADRLTALLTPRFLRADAAATRVAQLFRSGYVTNFTLAALAVLLSMLGLAVPGWVKPLLMGLEFATVAAILLVTSAGNRANWHRRWLDNRALAERLRCLALSSQLADLDLRNTGDQTRGWAAWYARATAREIGLPNVCADAGYLRCVRAELDELLDEQIAYLGADARRMHHLDHRLHVTGTVLFAVSAVMCVTMLVLQLTEGRLAPGFANWHDMMSTASTMLSASLPAIGAAIYGIRMQGDFSGIAGRSEALRHHLSTLREVVAADVLAFDTLGLRIRRVANLLTGDLASWLQTHQARPLTLPG